MQSRPQTVSVSLFKPAPRPSQSSRSAGVSVLGIVRIVLLCQPLPLIIVLRNVDALDLEDDRTRAVITAGDHHAVVVRPAFHDGAALQRRIDIPAEE